MRCKAGDLAVIVNDFRGCEANIGIIVKVAGPPEVHPWCDKLVWTVRPVKRRKLWVLGSPPGDMVLERQWVSKKYPIQHPDEWLLPLGYSPPEPEEEADEVTTIESPTSA